MMNNSVQATPLMGGGEQPSPQAEVRLWKTPCPPGEVPSGEAQVGIVVSREKFLAGMRVPGRSAGKMTDASTRAIGLVGSVVGPLVTLRLSADLAMPWQGVWAMALMIGGLPVIHVLLGNRDKE